MTEKQEYIMKNGVLFKWVDAYRKGGVYIACNQPYHYLNLGVSGDDIHSESVQYNKFNKKLSHKFKRNMNDGGLE